MSSRRASHRQSGFVHVVLLVTALLGTTMYGISTVQKQAEQYDSRSEDETARNLAQARRALLEHARGEGVRSELVRRDMLPPLAYYGSGSPATAFDDRFVVARPGALPCPDVVGDGSGANAAASGSAGHNDGNLDGVADYGPSLCSGPDVTPLSTGSRFGRLPWREYSDLVDVVKGAGHSEFVYSAGGERPWYAVSRNVADQSRQLNAMRLLRDAHGWLQLRVVDGGPSGLTSTVGGLAAIVALPGRPSATQVGRPPEGELLNAPYAAGLASVMQGGTLTDLYLETARPYGAGYSFVAGSDDPTADRVAYVHRDEIAALIADQPVDDLLDQVVEGLEAFEQRYGHLPDPASFESPHAFNLVRYLGRPSAGFAQDGARLSVTLVNGALSLVLGTDSEPVDLQGGRAARAWGLTDFGVADIPPIRLASGHTPEILAVSLRTTVFLHTEISIGNNRVNNLQVYTTVTRGPRVAAGTGLAFAQLGTGPTRGLLETEAAGHWEARLTAGSYVRAAADFYGALPTDHSGRIDRDVLHWGLEGLNQSGQVSVGYLSCDYASGRCTDGGDSDEQFADGYRANALALDSLGYRHLNPAGMRLRLPFDVLIRGTRDQLVEVTVTLDGGAESVQIQPTPHATFVPEVVARSTTAYRTASTDDEVEDVLTVDINTPLVPGHVGLLPSPPLPGQLRRTVVTLDRNGATVEATVFARDGRHYGSFMDPDFLEFDGQTEELVVTDPNGAFGSFPTAVTMHVGTRLTLSVGSEDGAADNTPLESFTELDVYHANRRPDTTDRLGPYSNWDPFHWRVESGLVVHPHPHFRRSIEPEHNRDGLRWNFPSRLQVMGSIEMPAGTRFHYPPGSRIPVGAGRFQHALAGGRYGTVVLTTSTRVYENQTVDGGVTTFQGRPLTDENRDACPEDILHWWFRDNVCAVSGGVTSAVSTVTSYGLATLVGREGNVQIHLPPGAVLSRARMLPRNFQAVHLDSRVDAPVWPFEEIRQQHFNSGVTVLDAREVAGHEGALFGTSYWGVPYVEFERLTLASGGVLRPDGDRRHATRLLHYDYGATGVQPLTRAQAAFRIEAHGLGVVTESVDETASVTATLTSALDQLHDGHYIYPYLGMIEPRSRRLGPGAGISVTTYIDNVVSRAHVQVVDVSGPADFFTTLSVAVGDTLQPRALRGGARFPAAPGLMHLHGEAAGFTPYSDDRYRTQGSGPGGPRAFTRGPLDEPVFDLVQTSAVADLDAALWADPGGSSDYSSASHEAGGAGYGARPSSPTDRFPLGGSASQANRVLAHLNTDAILSEGDASPLRVSAGARVEFGWLDAATVAGRVSLAPAGRVSRGVGYYPLPKDVVMIFNSDVVSMPVDLHGADVLSPAVARAALCSGGTNAFYFRAHGNGYGGRYHDRGYAEYEDNSGAGGCGNSRGSFIRLSEVQFALPGGVEVHGLLQPSKSVTVGGYRHLSVTVATVEDEGSWFVQFSPYPLVNPLDYFFHTNGPPDESGTDWSTRKSKFILPPEFPLLVNEDFPDLAIHFVVDAGGVVLAPDGDGELRQYDRIRQGQILRLRVLWNGGDPVVLRELSWSSVDGMYSFADLEPEAHVFAQNNPLYYAVAPDCRRLTSYSSRDCPTAPGRGLEVEVPPSERVRLPSEEVVPAGMMIYAPRNAGRSVIEIVEMGGYDNTARATVIPIVRRVELSVPSVVERFEAGTVTVDGVRIGADGQLAGLHRRNVPEVNTADVSVLGYAPGTTLELRPSPGGLLFQYEPDSASTLSLPDGPGWHGTLTVVAGGYTWGAMDHAGYRLTIAKNTTINLGPGATFSRSADGELSLKMGLRDNYAYTTSGRLITCGSCYNYYRSFRHQTGQLPGGLELLTDGGHTELALSLDANLILQADGLTSPRWVEGGNTVTLATRPPALQRLPAGAEITITTRGIALPFQVAGDDFEVSVQNHGSSASTVFARTYRDIPSYGNAMLRHGLPGPFWVGTSGQPTYQWQDFQMELQPPEDVLSAPLAPPPGSAVCLEAACQVRPPAVDDNPLLASGSVYYGRQHGSGVPRLQHGSWLSGLAGSVALTVSHGNAFSRDGDDDAAVWTFMREADVNRYFGLPARYEERRVDPESIPRLHDFSSAVSIAADFGAGTLTIDAVVHGLASLGFGADSDFWDEAHAGMRALHFWRDVEGFAPGDMDIAINVQPTQPNLVHQYIHSPTLSVSVPGGSSTVYGLHGQTGLVLDRFGAGGSDLVLTIGSDPEFPGPLAILPDHRAEPITAFVSGALSISGYRGNIPNPGTRSDRQASQLFVSGQGFRVSVGGDHDLAFNLPEDVVVAGVTLPEGSRVHPRTGLYQAARRLPATARHIVITLGAAGAEGVIAGGGDAGRVVPFSAPIMVSFSATESNIELGPVPMVYQSAQPGTATLRVREEARLISVAGWLMHPTDRWWWLLDTRRAGAVISPPEDLASGETRLVLPFLAGGTARNRFRYIPPVLAPARHRIVIPPFATITLSNPEFLQLGTYIDNSSLVAAAGGGDADSIARANAGVARFHKDADPFVFPEGTELHTWAPTAESATSTVTISIGGMMVKRYVPPYGAVESAHNTVTLSIDVGRARRLGNITNNSPLADVELDFSVVTMAMRQDLWLQLGDDAHIDYIELFAGSFGTGDDRSWRSQARHVRHRLAKDTALNVHAGTYLPAPAPARQLEERARLHGDDVLEARTDLVFTKPALVLPAGVTVATGSRGLRFTGVKGLIGYSPHPLEATQCRGVLHKAPERGKRVIELNQQEEGVTRLDLIPGARIDNYSADSALRYNVYPSYYVVGLYKGETGDGSATVALREPATHGVHHDRGTHPPLVYSLGDRLIELDEAAGDSLLGSGATTTTTVTLHGYGLDSGLDGSLIPNRTLTITGTVAARLSLERLVTVHPEELGLPRATGSQFEAHPCLLLDTAANTDRDNRYFYTGGNRYDAETGRVIINDRFRLIGGRMVP